MLLKLPLRIAPKQQCEEHACGLVFAKTTMFLGTCIECEKKTASPSCTYGPPTGFGSVSHKITPARTEIQKLNFTAITFT
mmetsp:Transcript_39480/g.73303  ORF Transcript_39480/g.73303 Transcript_39480/m.73303 type:complete len:80 (-) Transcript_39480:1021-1260(-)